MNVRRTAWTDDLGYVRPGQQSRSQRTQSALMDAAEELIAEQGVDATTLADIATRAGSSVGAIYHHFRDKSAIQYAVFERFVEEAEATTLDAVSPERWDGAEIADIVHGYVSYSVQSNAERPSVKRAALAIARTDTEFAARFTKLSAILDQGLRELLLARRSEIGHHQPELAIDYSIHLLAAVLRARLEHPSDSTRSGPAADEEFVAETTNVVCGYLDLPTRL